MVDDAISTRNILCEIDENDFSARRGAKHEDCLEGCCENAFHRAGAVKVKAQQGQDGWKPQGASRVALQLWPPQCARRKDVGKANEGT